MGGHKVGQPHMWTSHSPLLRLSDVSLRNAWRGGSDCIESAEQVGGMPTSRVGGGFESGSISTNLGVDHQQRPGEGRQRVRMFLQRRLGGGEEQRVAWPDEATEIFALRPPSSRRVLKRGARGGLICLTPRSLSEAGLRVYCASTECSCLLGYGHQMYFPGVLMKGRTSWKVIRAQCASCRNFCKYSAHIESCCLRSLLD